MELVHQILRRLGASTGADLTPTVLAVAPSVITRASELEDRGLSALAGPHVNESTGAVETGPSRFAGIAILVGLGLGLAGMAVYVGRFTGPRIREEIKAVEIARQKGIEEAREARRRGTSKDDKNLETKGIEAGDELVEKMIRELVAAGEKQKALALMAWNYGERVHKVAMIQLGKREWLAEEATQDMFARPAKTVIDPVTGERTEVAAEDLDPRAFKRFMAGTRARDGKPVPLARLLIQDVKNRAIDLLRRESPGTALHGYEHTMQEGGAAPELPDLPTLEIIIPSDPSAPVLTTEEKRSYTPSPNDKQITLEAFPVRTYIEKNQWKVDVEYRDPSTGKLFRKKTIPITGRVKFTQVSVDPGFKGGSALGGQKAPEGYSPLVERLDVMLRDDKLSSYGDSPEEALARQQLIEHAARAAGIDDEWRRTLLVMSTGYKVQIEKLRDEVDDARARLILARDTDVARRVEHRGAIEREYQQQRAALEEAGAVGEIAVLDKVHEDRLTAAKADLEQAQREHNAEIFKTLREPLEKIQELEKLRRNEIARAARENLDETKLSKGDKLTYDQTNAIDRFAKTWDEKHEARFIEALSKGLPKPARGARIDKALRKASDAELRSTMPLIPTELTPELIELQKRVYEQAIAIGEQRPDDPEAATTFIRRHAPHASIKRHAEKHLTPGSEAHTRALAIAEALRMHGRKAQEDAPSELARYMAKRAQGSERLSAKLAEAPIPVERDLPPIIQVHVPPAPIRTPEQIREATRAELAQMREEGRARELVELKRAAKKKGMKPEEIEQIQLAPDPMPISLDPTPEGLEKLAEKRAAEEKVRELGEMRMRAELALKEAMKRARALEAELGVLKREGARGELYARAENDFREAWERADALALEYQALRAEFPAVSPALSEKLEREKRELERQLRKAGRIANR